MAAAIATISDARDTIDRLQQERARARAAQEERRENVQLLAYFAGTRVVSTLVETMFPQFGTLRPIAEIGGGLFLLNQAMDPREQNPGAKLGAALALLIGPIDRISTFFKDTVAKFTSKK